MSPQFSIIIPVFKVECFLPATLRSLLNQTYTDWEVICIDDGSPDLSGKILDVFAKKDSRFMVLHQKNQGAAAARNAGLKLAKGKWLTYLDADDQLANGWLEEAVRVIKAEEPDVVRLGYTFAQTPPEGFYTRKGGSTIRTYEGKDAYAWGVRTFFPEGFLWATFIRRDLTTGVLFDLWLRCKEDSIWLLNVLPRINKVCVSDYKGYFYRASAGSLSRGHRSVSQCVSYLSALGELWMEQKENAAVQGASKIFLFHLRYSADNDVVEWIMKNNGCDSDDGCTVRRAYLALKRLGALTYPYNHKLRYRIGMWMWEKSGLYCMVYWPGIFFLHLREFINRMKE